MLFQFGWVFASLALALAAESSFVRVERDGFVAEGKPYRFLGANFWQGMNLGMPGTAGDRGRLVRELDRLAALGVKNLRVMAVSEGPDSEPWRVVPALQPEPGKVREDVWVGLDFLLAEMNKRGMRAVMTLSNFWPWSGGFSQYLAWSGAGSIPYPPPQTGGDWATYQTYTEKFYSNVRAVSLYQTVITKLITRVNTVTGRPYRLDPAIFSWQLANEPRGGRNVADFHKWIASTSALIKSLDPNHLVTTGSEGETPWPSGSGLELVADHSARSIDYATAHVWAQNWGWFDPARAAQTYSSAVASMRSYVHAHAEKARILGKPLVFEEFGLARDGGSFDPSASTLIRDRYFNDVFSAIHLEARAGWVSGVNFWAWSGEGTPAAPFGGFWKPGTPFTGDPPHEQQGWYGVYAEDHSTLDLIGIWASKFSEL